MGGVKKTLLSVQQIFLLIVGVAIVFFAFLNLETVTVDLFFTTVTTSVALLMLVPLAGGLVLGLVGGRLRARRKEKSRGEVGAGPVELPPGDRKVENVDWENLDLDQIDV